MTCSLQMTSALILQVVVGLLVMFRVAWSSYTTIVSVPSVPALAICKVWFEVIGLT